MSTKRTSKLFALLLSLVIMIYIMPTTAFATETISSVSARITEPVVKVVPDFDIILGDSDQHNATLMWQMHDDSVVIQVDSKTPFRAGKTYGEWTVTKEVTATEAGSKESVCSVCGYKKTIQFDTCKRVKD